jgi:hypothetical protein
MEVGLAQIFSSKSASVLIIGPALINRQKSQPQRIRPLAQKKRPLI